MKIVVKSNKNIHSYNYFVMIYAYAVIFVA